MAVDIGEELRKKVQTDFFKRFYANKEIQVLKANVKTIKDAYRFADLVSAELTASFKKFVTKDALPDGKMYYNIAYTVLNSSLSENHKLATEVYALVQEQTNYKAGVQIKSLLPPVNKDRLGGLIDKLSSYEDFDDAKWVLDAPVNNFTRNSIIESVKANAEFLEQAGLNTLVIRRLGAGGCCDWCKKLAGTYQMPDVPSEVFMAHENCDCTIEVISKKDGRYNMRQTGHGFTRF